MRKETEDKRLTPSTLAARWKITPHTLSQWRWNGRGPQFLKVGRRILYKLNDVEAFEEKKIYQNTSQIKEEEEQ